MKYDAERYTDGNNVICSSEPRLHTSWFNWQMNPFAYRSWILNIRYIRRENNLLNFLRDFKEAIILKKKTKDCFFKLWWASKEDTQNISKWKEKK